MFADKLSELINNGYGIQFLPSNTYREFRVNVLKNDLMYSTRFVVSTVAQSRCTHDDYLISILELAKKEFDMYERSVKNA